MQSAGGLSWLLLETKERGATLPKAGCLYTIFGTALPVLASDMIGLLFAGKLVSHFNGGMCRYIVAIAIVVV